MHKFKWTLLVTRCKNYRYMIQARDVCKIWELFNLVSNWMKTVGLFVSISKSKKKKNKVCFSITIMLFEKPKHHQQRLSEFQAVILAGYGSSNR